MKTNIKTKMKTNTMSNGMSNKLSHIMNRALMGLLVVFTMVVLGACNIESGVTPLEAPDYDSIITEVLGSQLIGVAVHVENPRLTVTQFRGYADWENLVPLKENDLSRIASCSKPFISTLVMMLHYEGNLNVDNGITNYLPASITDNIQYADRITIRQLLNHTSGIVNIDDNDAYWGAVFENPFRIWSDEEAVTYAYLQPGYFEPGEGLEYSNTNYLLMGIILDRVLGFHHSKAIREKILVPLGMKNTFYEHHEQYDTDRLVHGYFDFDGNGEVEDYRDFNIGAGLAASGLISTVEDMSHFLRSLLVVNGFPGADYQQALLDDFMPRDGGAGIGLESFDYGYGPCYGHTGADPGYLSVMLYFPDHDVTIAMTLNGLEGGFEGFQIIPVLYERIVEATFTALEIEKESSGGLAEH
ncbi:MAG: beta-lactamase family protein [bacterium]|nr:beta-lactamase family protein [bacterium]